MLGGGIACDLNIVSGITGLLDRRHADTKIEIQVATYQARRPRHGVTGKLATLGRYG